MIGGNGIREGAGDSDETSVGVETHAVRKEGCSGSSDLIAISLALAF